MQQDKLSLGAVKVKKVFETEWFSIDAISQKKSHRPYYRLSCNDSVVIVALTEDHKLILIRQYRPAIGTSMLEFPAGQIDLGETPEVSIKRELEEETGYRCGSLSYVGPYRVDPCRINSMVHLFFGKDAKLTGKKQIEDEIEEVITISEEEFKEMIKDRKFIAASGVGFYSLAKLKGLF
ncbi:MAG: NUDIX hydrolase [Elusimicrobia bacterium]|nr:NUDIX hydrolase [Elusimicrobiota bacterium]